MTFHLRRQWHLNMVLGDRDVKNRADHRHHAIDAIIIALTDTRTVQILQRAAERADEAGRRLFAPVEQPWEGFVDDVQAVVDRIVVSHRQGRRARGPLHAESLYSKPYPGDKEPEFRIRKELHRLSPTEADRIIDPAVRDAVRRKLDELGEKNPAKAFADPANHPHLPTRDGRRIPIHKVRLKARVKAHKIGSAGRERYVKSTKGSNHHTVVYARVAPGGEETAWVDVPVTLREVYERRSGKGKQQKPIVLREVPKNCIFRFSLAANEYVEMDDEAGGRAIYRVLSISKGDIELLLHTDGRTAKKREEAKQRVRLGGIKLFKRNARKIFVNYLGEVADAGG